MCEFEEVRYVYALCRCVKSILVVLLLLVLFKSVGFLKGDMLLLKLQPPSWLWEHISVRNLRERAACVCCAGV